MRIYKKFSYLLTALVIMMLPLSAMTAEVVTEAPVKKIKMNDLSKAQEKKEKKVVKKKNYILVINDFYYVDSANNLKDELVKKIKMSNIYVKKINDNKYRLLAGPFKNFNALKSSYISLNNLGFEDLNIYRE